MIVSPPTVQSVMQENYRNLMLLNEALPSLSYKSMMLKKLMSLTEVVPFQG